MIFIKLEMKELICLKKVHPLFMTRGVPGTHDINLINKIINQLKKKNFKTVLIPKFDKSIDNRLKKIKMD